MTDATAVAIKTYEGIKEIAKNEQLVRGSYIEEYIRREDLHERGAICNGQRACFLGSMALACPEVTRMSAWDKLVASFGGDEELAASYTSPETAERVVDVGEPDRGFFNAGQRPDVLEERPGLRLAYETAEEIAEEWVTTGHVELDIQTEEEWGGFTSKSECLFETAVVDLVKDERDDNVPTNLVIELCDEALYRLSAVSA